MQIMNLKIEKMLGILRVEEREVNEKGCLQIKF